MELLRHLKNKIKNLKWVHNRYMQTKNSFLNMKFIASLIVKNFNQRDVIYHLGIFGEKINVGDNILYYELEKISNN